MDEQAMQKWMEMSSPNENHKLLEEMAGSWDVTTTVWMGGPGGETMVSQGTSETEVVYGGRFLKEVQQNDMGGQPFEGLGYVGYDNLKKKYVQLWIDSMGTGIYRGEGSFNSETRILTFFGTMDDAISGEHDKMMKYEVHLIDENSRRFEIHDLSFPVGNTKTLEMVYTRKK
ncbi:DUF1579 domain-containing protein [bacterium]|nr:DUF1579 domain-containing protein [bacterium]